MRNLSASAFALDPGGRQHEMRVRISPPQHANDVPQCSAVKRRDDADSAGERRQRTFTCRVEQTLGGQLLLELFECLLQRAETLRLDVLADNLIFAFGVVDADLAARHHLQSVLRLELQVAHRGSEHYRFDLRRAVFQREIHVPGVPDTGVRNFAFHPNRLKRVLEQIANGRIELADGEDDAGRGLNPGRFVERQPAHAFASSDAASVRAFSSSSLSERRTMFCARPLTGSTVITTPLSRGSPVAVSNRPGNPVTNRAMIASLSMPITPSCGPVMPTSVRHAVPPGRMRSSAVCTCVCVPITAETLPST